MEIKFKCDCGQALKVPQEAAGKTGKCPSCGKQVRIPTIEEVQAQPVPVQIVFAPAQPQPPVASVPAQPPSEVGLKKVPVRPTAPKATKSALERIRPRQARPAAGSRSRTGIRVRRRGAEEEEEGVPDSAGKKKKQLMLAGAIAAVALIALLIWYFGSVKPAAQWRQRHQDYKEKTLEFNSEVVDLCNTYAGKDAPSTSTQFRSKVDSIKSKFEVEEGPKDLAKDDAVMRGLPSYKAMVSVLKKLDDALSLVQERAQTTESKKEDIDRINSNFQALIKECSALAANIEKSVKTLREE
jgi:uncharacterized protein YoxC